MTNEMPDWKEKYINLSDDVYYDLKGYQNKTKELQDEVESVRMEAKGWKAEAKELRAALETLCQYVDTSMPAYSTTGESFKQMIIMGIDRMLSNNHEK
jgi:cell division septum initiation protein DivIVA